MYRDFCGICFLSSAAKCIAGKDYPPPQNAKSAELVIRHLFTTTALFNEVTYAGQLRTQIQRQMCT